MSSLCFKDWILGKAIGVGGFGELYLAASRQNSSAQNYVIKVGNQAFSGKLIEQILLIQNYVL